MAAGGSSSLSSSRSSSGKRARRPQLDAALTLARSTRPSSLSPSRPPLSQRVLPVEADRLRCGGSVCRFPRTQRRDGKVHAHHDGEFSPSSSLAGFDGVSMNPRIGNEATDPKRASPVIRELRAACERNDRHRVRESACWSQLTIYRRRNTQAPCVISRNDVGIGTLVFGRHYLHREATLECGADHRSVNSVEMSHCVNSLLDIFNDESSFSITDHFRHRTLIEGNDWRAAGHGLDHHETEGLGPRDQERVGQGRHPGSPTSRLRLSHRRSALPVR